MPNSIGPTGLSVATQAELLTQFTTDLQAIFGADINIDADTPDGQLINIFIQSVLDLEDQLVQIYNSMDPDNAVGVILDQRVAINGIQRQAGTFTLTNVTVVTSQACTLYGLDQALQPVYTVQDNAGTQWQLQTTTVISGAGSQVLVFQAALPGAVQSLPNTITTPVTIVLGVTSINNPTTFTTLGINEETDAALKIRRQKSVSLSSQGFLAGLLGALENINGVTSAFIHENVTNATDGDGVPGHSIWVIVAGTAAAADIANAIYTKRNAGCGMKGSISFNITQLDGSTFQVFWDDVVSQNLFIKFTASSIDGVNAPNLAAILDPTTGLASIFKPGVNAEVDINHMATLVQQIDPNCLVTSAGFGLVSTGPFTNTLSPTLKNYQFSVVNTNIIILPMILTPTSATVQTTHTKTFLGLGGFGTLVYSFQTNNSGGSINSSTGLYTAGAVTGVTDTVLVTDSLANTATATVAVTT